MDKEEYMSHKSLNARFCANQDRSISFDWRYRAELQRYVKISATGYSNTQRLMGIWGSNYGLLVSFDCGTIFIVVLLRRSPILLNKEVLPQSGVNIITRK